MLAVYNDPEIISKALRLLERRFGPVDTETDETEFLHTRAYVEEMGEGLKKRMFSFVNPVDTSQLVRIKRRITRIEAKLSDRVSDLTFRRVNLDPLLLGPSGLTLVSRKDGAQRVCLEKEMYAEKTLALASGKLRPFPWTPPGLSDEEALDFLENLLKSIDIIPPEFSRLNSLNLF